MGLIITIVVVLGLALVLGIINSIQEKKDAKTNDDSMKNI